MILVPAAQYFAGRQCAVRLSTQRQRPSTGGEVMTSIAFSAAARSRTRLLNATMTGWPTP